MTRPWSLTCAAEAAPALLLQPLQPLQPLKPLQPLQPQMLRPQVKLPQRYCNHLDINSISRHMEYHAEALHALPTHPSVASVAPARAA
jgi:hypothetical protein